MVGEGNEEIGRGRESVEAVRVLRVGLQVLTGQQGPGG